MTTTSMHMVLKSATAVRGCSSPSDLEMRGYLDDSRDNKDPFLEGEHLPALPHTAIPAACHVCNPCIASYPVYPFSLIAEVFICLLHSLQM